MSTLRSANRDRIPEAQFAFPNERKLPLEDASHVRNALARFDQVQGVSDHERDAAWQRITKAAAKHQVEIHASSWRDLGGER